MKSILQEKTLACVAKVLPKKYTQTPDAIVGFIQQSILVVLCLLLITLAAGTFFHNLFSMLGTGLLVLYYLCAYETSNVKKFQWKIVLVIFIAYLLFNIAVSTNSTESFNVFKPATYKGFCVLLLAIESIRSTKDIAWVILASVAASLWQGVDGIWQYFTGFDFVHNTAIYAGRLTGSLKTYRVGNLMFFLLVPGSALYLVLRHKVLGFFPTWASSRLGAFVTTSVLLAPGIFLFVFAVTRSAYLAVIAAYFFLFVFCFFRLCLWQIGVIVSGISAALLGLVFYGPTRLTWKTLMQDGRLEIWDWAISVFKEYPLLGVGIGNFSFIADKMGLTGVMHKPINIGHPHSIYLQFLSEMGVIGFVIGMLFLYFFLFWGFSQVKSALNLALNKQQRLQWQLTAFFLATWAGFLVNIVFSHSFFRPWYLSSTFIILGVLIGAIVTFSSQVPDNAKEVPCE